MAEPKAAKLGLLLRCYEALHNWRALVLLAAGFALAALLAVLGVFITQKLGWSHPQLGMLLGGLVGLIAALVVLAAINGAGLLLVDQADGNVPRGLTAAFFGGLGVTLQAVVCLIALGVGLLLVIVVLWGLSFLGKIPAIGPAFAFVLAGPTLLILAFCYAVLVFGVALMFAALWRGHGMVGSVGRAIDIVVKQPLDVVLHFVVLGLLIVPIEIFVGAILVASSGLTGTMYASSALLGSGLLGGGFYGAGPLAMLAGAGASTGAAGVSIGIVLAAVWALFVLVGMLGNILIFDSLAADTRAASTGFLQDKFTQVKRKLEESRPRAPVAPAEPFTGPAYGHPAADATCASCGAALTPGDQFCGECGTPAA